MNENDGIYEEFTEKPMDDTLLKFFGVYGFDILTSLTENHWIHAKFCPSFGCPKLKLQRDRRIVHKNAGIETRKEWGN